MVNQPRTEAGRTFLAALMTMDALNHEPVLVDWAHGIRAIEAEASDRPPTGYWCCALDWNNGTFRTGYCIGPTMPPNPQWQRVFGSARSSR